MSTTDSMPDNGSAPLLGLGLGEGLGHKPRTLQVTCPHCHSAAKLVDGRAIYPHRPDLSSKRFWQCKPCAAYVGCHAPGSGQGDGTKPLGRLANAALRKAKKDAHFVFDALWVNEPRRGRARHAAYKWLAEAMGMTADECHIGEMDVQQCERVADLVSQRHLAEMGITHVAGRDDGPVA